MIGSTMNASFTSQRRVLVVEDESATRQLLRTHLLLAGFQVEENSDGASALEQTRQTKYDLILLEVMLPGSSSP